MEKFEIEKIKRVTYVYDEDQVNEHLNAGWILLAAGFQKNEEGSEPMCVLGHFDEAEPIEESDLD